MSRFRSVYSSITLFSDCSSFGGYCKGKKGERDYFTNNNWIKIDNVEVASIFRTIPEIFGTKKLGAKFKIVKKKIEKRVDENKTKRKADAYIYSFKNYKNWN